MPIPALDARGLLPPGLHLASLEEVPPRFCTNPHRHQLWDGALAGLDVLCGEVRKHLPITPSLVLGGSFFSVKPVPLSPALLARAFVFDCFIHNPDRHPGNYLLRLDTHAPTGRLLVFDFSRAFAVNGWPLPPLPLPATSNTIQVTRALFRIHGFDRPAAIAAIRRLQSLPDDTMSRLCELMPPAWLPGDPPQALDAWWRSGRSGRALSVLSEVPHA